MLFLSRIGVVMKKIIRIYNCIAIIYLMICVIFISLFFANSLFSIRLIGDDKIYINVNKKYYENGYAATFLNKKVDGIEIYSNVNTSKVGKYYVYYIKRFTFFNNLKKRIVYVVDNEKPSITLKGSDYVYLNLNDNYIEDGYEAFDNVDGNLTDKVEVKSDINNQAAGNYMVNYRIKDSSGNESEISRNVEVINSNYLTCSISEFSLKNKFKDVILEYEDKEYDYLKDTIFLGDCNTLFLFQKGNYLSKNQIWGQYNLNIAQINHSVFITFSNNQIVDFDTAMAIHNPKYLVVNMGLNTANYMDKDTMINELDFLIEHMKKEFPNTKLIISSIVPVREFGTANGIYSMNRMNHYNYYTIQECHKYGIKYINYADEIKNDKGYGDDNYLYCTEENDCGFHLSDLGKTKYIEYLKHLNFER